MVSHSQKKVAAVCSDWWENNSRQAVPLAPFRVRGGPMLVARHRFTRNPYFHFHPLHSLFSLLAAVILFGLLVWFLAVPAR
jgi:hypothetical protein